MDTAAPETDTQPGVDVAHMVQGYREQVTATVDGLRQRGTSLSQDIQAQANLDQIKAQLEPRVQALQAQLTDMSPAPTPASQRVLSVHVVTSMALTAATVGHVLGAYLLSPIIGLAFSGALSALTAFVLLPAYTAHYSRTQEGSLKEEERHMLVVAAALAMGVLSGHTLSGCYLTYTAPPTVLLPVSVALVSAYLGAKLADNRPALLGAAIGGAVAGELVLGVVSGSLGGSYLLYTVATAALYAGAVQLVLANEQDVSTQAVAVTAAQLALQAALTLLTAYSQEGYQQMKANL